MTIPTGPTVCSNIRDIHDNETEYVKTICHIGIPKSRFIANQICEANGMALANPDKFVDELILFASRLYSTGGWIWVGGQNGLNCRFEKHFLTSTSSEQIFNYL